MKTEISRFCTTCAETLGTMPAALEAAASQCEQGGPLLQGPLTALNDVRAHLRSLTDKLHSQQAYLLIFGPLKSGKSTLMNAISGAYVSEVTSLPGYPCLVFVQHADESRYSATRYNGRESVFPDAIVLKDVVADAHHALAQQIRATELRGEAFDPRTSFPEAIRRIDIKVPVPTLAESSTVLVDTPGLYSRMNFGYDVLTREFRDSAACAVFVVKTDNLFLEQVFAEFNQLLGLFSRIFIVVNVDAGKRDLTPDGSLAPSAESAKPERIIEAFTTFSMAGPMREAYEAGRVRLHAVDLLGAASEFLSGTPGELSHRAPFDAFLRDLTDYLNSSDYTREFILDSLRQARTLCEEAKAVAVGDEAKKVREQQDTLGGEMRDLDVRLAAAERLLKVDWNALFQALRTGHARTSDEEIRLRTAQLREDLRKGLNRWYAGSEGLAALTQAHWNPSITEAARMLGQQAKGSLERLATNPLAGLQAPSDVVADMQIAGFSPAPSGQRALGSLTAQEDPTAYKITVKADGIPVQKSFLDWILFRGVATVRRRLFGEDLTREILPAEKEKRLREESRAEFERMLEAALQERLPGRPTKYAEALADSYVTRAREEILAGVRTLRDHLARERAQRQVPFERQAKIIGAFAELEAQAGRVALEIDLLAAEEEAKLTPPPIPAGAVVAEAIGDDVALGYIAQVTPLPLLE
jgi:hypothetical protein